MWIYALILLSLLCSPGFAAAFDPSRPADAVSYPYHAGRLGDNLICYLHAKWFAYQNKIPFLYRTFPYSSEFAFSIKEESMARQHDYPNIYMCSYFPEAKWELTSPPSHYFEVDWKDVEFRKIAREMIFPVNELNLIQPPKNKLSVALHFREGGGADPKNFSFSSPKSPPINYYIECLLKVLELFPSRPIYCYFFTDALKPSEFLQQIQEGLPPQALIEFDCRSWNESDFQPKEKGSKRKKKGPKATGPNANVIEDFFSLFNFDILIRPESNFSIVPSLIHDFAIVFTPGYYFDSNNRVVVDGYSFSIDFSKLEQLK